MVDFKWDKWQLDVLARQGSLVCRVGRQSGKSEVISEKAKEFAKNNPDTTTLVIAATQRQSSLLFEKIRFRCDWDDGVVFAEKPTLTKIVLDNSSKIYCVPAGRTGYGIRGYTVDLLIADEAPYIPETVWSAVTPMLAVSKNTKGFGWTILIGTPFGKGGYYYECCHDKDFLHIHFSSENCKRIDKSFLAKERKRMTKMMYQQEYMAEFTEEFQQYFSTALIKECMTFIEWDRKVDGVPGGRFYLGQDLARLGGDEIADVIVELNGGRLKAVKCMAIAKLRANETIGQTVALDAVWGFKKIFTDSAGLGGPILDLMQVKLGKRRVVGLNNATKKVQVEGEPRRKGLMKEDLYANTLLLMEEGKLELIADPDLLRSLKSITYEYTDEGRFKIKGSYTHLTEALVRACWCVKDKGLDLFIF